jgi:AraC-like DNA-binding protein
VAPSPAPTRLARRDPAELLSAAYTAAAATDPRLVAAGPVVHLSSHEVRRERGLSTIVALLRAALMEPSAGQERLAHSLLDPLLEYVLHCHARAGAGGLAGDAAEPSDERVARALRLMQSRPAERWSVAALAKAAGLSRAAFARRFLAELGAPPLRHLAELRMRIAARLLAEGDDSLASIAAEVGYESEFAFSRAFKRWAGQAPGAFRRAHRSGGAALRLPPTRAAA